MRGLCRLPGIAVTCLAVVASNRRGAAGEAAEDDAAGRGGRRRCGRRADAVHTGGAATGPAVRVPLVDFDAQAISEPTAGGDEGGAGGSASPVQVVVQGRNVAFRMTACTTSDLYDQVLAAPLPPTRRRR